MTGIAASYHPSDTAVALIYKRWQYRPASPVVDTGKSLRTTCWSHERVPYVSEATEELTFAVESQGDRLRPSSAVVLTVGRHTAPADACVIHRREEVLMVK